MREAVEPAMRVIVGALASRARSVGDPFLYGVWTGIMANFGAGALAEALMRWCEAEPRPVVLLVDEIDTLVGDTLISVLRQLRAGYDLRPSGFPQSVVLCGVRDVRDYRIRSSAENTMVTGGSAFNVKAASLRLGDFTQADVRALLAQHTAETGQPFTREALGTVWRQTCGQPWLVNALCRQACFDSESGRDRSRAIAAADLLDAQEHLILNRVTHLDQLADQLREDRVRRVVEPLLSGGDRRAFSGRDLEYVRDLGLVARAGPVRIANPIYAEVVPRELTWVVQEELAQDLAWYVDADGGLDLDKLLAAFQGFSREHSEHWVALRLHRSRPATAVAGVPAPSRQRRGAHRARVRTGEGPHRSAHHLAVRGRRAAGRNGAGQYRPVRGRVQGAAQEPAAYDSRRSCPDGRLRGPLRSGVRAPGDLRPDRRETVGGTDLPSRGTGGRWPRDYGVGM